jgi:hypothetical protein
MRLKLFVLVLACVSSFGALTGCTTLSYKEPKNGPTARVRFVTDISKITVVRGYDNSNCGGNEKEWMRLRDGELLNNEPKRLGIALWDFHKNAAKEVLVDTSNQSTFLISSVMEQGSAYRRKLFSCGVPVSLHFQPGKDYEIAFHMSFQGCSADVSQISLLNGVPARTNITTFENQVSSANAACLDRFKTRRLY